MPDVTPIPLGGYTLGPVPARTRNATYRFGAALGLSRGTWRLARHFGEMVLAMVLGMAVAAGAAAGVLALAGSSTDSLETSAPGVVVMGMFVSMTFPMAAWMRHRCHSWRAVAEMSAAMLAPTLAALALLVAGAVDVGAALGIEHIAMIAAMLAVMLWRRDEYARASRPRTHA